MTVTWLIVALVTWPLLALAIGLVIGRGISVARGRVPPWSPNVWVRRELPANLVAPERNGHDQEPTRI